MIGPVARIQANARNIEKMASCKNPVHGKGESESEGMGLSKFFCG
jgi:hypothetical protein